MKQQNNAIVQILKAAPKAVFCGSYILHLKELLKRTPKDVDVLLTIADFKKLKKYSTYYTVEQGYDKRRLGAVDRRPIKIDGLVCCVFIVDKYPSNIVTYDIPKVGVIRAQKVLDILTAKRNWSHIDKHVKDLKEVESNLPF